LNGSLNSSVSNLDDVTVRNYGVLQTGEFFPQIERRTKCLFKCSEDLEVMKVPREAFKLMPKDVLAMLLIHENELYAALNFQTDERRGSE
jgi:hypothetical protein